MEGLLYPRFGLDKVVRKRTLYLPLPVMQPRSSCP